MSWFSQKDWSSFAQSAKTALSTAQKTIDRALDIDENEEGTDQASSSQEREQLPPQPSTSSTNVDTESFFTNFLSPSPQQGELVSSRTSKSPKRRKGASASNKSQSITAEGTLVAEVSLPGARSLEPSEGQFREIRLDDGDTSAEKRSSKDSKHNRSKSTGGTISPVNSQKSNGLSSCSESIEVLSLISSEKLGESYYQDFISAPPKLNVLHKALKNGSSDGESAGAIEHSPNSCSDDAVEPASSSDPDVSQAENNAALVSSSFASFSDSHSTQVSGPQSETRASTSESVFDNRVQSWFMVTDNVDSSPIPTLTPTNSLFQPDLVPVEAVVTECTADALSVSDSYERPQLVQPPNMENLWNPNYDADSVVPTEDARSRTPPDIQQMTSSHDVITSETSPVLPDVQLNTPAVSVLPSNIEVDVPHQFGTSPPDLTQSPRERPDILTSEYDTQNRPPQNVDLVVQELDVIRAVGQSSNPDLSPELGMNEGQDDSADALNSTIVESNTVDLVVQELDVVQGNEHSSSRAVTSLDILPSNGDAAEVQSPDETYQQMSILHDIPVSRMDRNGAVGQFHSSFNEDMAGNTHVIDELLKRIAILEETVQTRETQLISVNQRATTALEENDLLKSRLEEQQAGFEDEKNRLVETHQLETNTITIKYNSNQQKLKDLEKQLADLKNASSFSSQLQSSLVEKDEIIEEMRKEGEKLAQEEYKKNSVIKKLKAKEKELQASLDKTKQVLDEKTAELDSVTESFTKLQQKVAEQRDTINQMNHNMTKNEQLLVKRTNENEELSEKTGALQNNLDTVFKELKELQQQLADKEAEFVKSRAAVDEEASHEREEALRLAEGRWDEEREVLKQEIQDAALSTSRTEQAALRREALLKDEMKHLQMRLEDEMQRGQVLSEGVSQATQPLWNQISRLQRQQQDQQTQWGQLENNYLQRLAEAESRAGQAVESERLANENLVEVRCKLSSVEAQLDTVRNQHSKLAKTVEEKEENAKKLEVYNEKLKEEITTLTGRLTSADHEILVLQGELSTEKQSADQQKRKYRSIEEQNRELTLKLRDVSTSNLGNSSLMSTPGNKGVSDGMPGQTFLSPVPISPGEASYKNGSSSTPVAVVNPRTVSSWEFLESQVKLKDGEASALQNEVRKLEQQNITLREDFIRLSNERHDWLSDREELKLLKDNHRELSERYETLLTMYGEKAEEVDELKLDLSDVKVIYKAQIEDLVKKLVQHKS